MLGFSLLKLQNLTMIHGSVEKEVSEELHTVKTGVLKQCEGRNEAIPRIC